MSSMKVCRDEIAWTQTRLSHSPGLPAWLAAAVFAFGLLYSPLPAAGQDEIIHLRFRDPELAGISGFRRYWDLPVVLSGDGVVEIVDHGEFGAAPSAVWDPDQRDNGSMPGALVVDALHRRALVRFPGLAEAVRAQLANGYRIRKVELVLPFRDTELWPFDYVMPSGMSFLGGRWAHTPPRWSVIAWPLRRPWTADPDLGPTVNAWIHRTAYWEQFAAADDRLDRFPDRFGPVEVSYREATAYQDVEQKPEERPHVPDSTVSLDRQAGDSALLDDILAEMEEETERLENPEEYDQPARMDITPVLSDAAYGQTLGQRLRLLEECGLMLAKWEEYDLRYKDVWSGYEWATTTGGRGILLRTPALEVTLERAPGGPTPDSLPAATDVHALANAIRAEGGSGAPSATVAGPAEFEALYGRHGAAPPEWMPEWQWNRVAELMAAENTAGLCEFPDTYDRYLQWLDDLLGWTPRHFIGHRTPRRAAVALRHRAAMPEPVRAHLATYWRGWLMPDRRHDQLVHPQAIASGTAQRDYLRRTDDWRGNTSYYRGYVRVGSTMNFNHTSIAGALLGGRLLDAQYPLDDARYGLENLLLRRWAWLDGSTQETIDHYYLSITLFATKDMVDFGPTPLDRLMARSALTKYVEELTSHYHPFLRRFIGPSGRTALNFLWVTQDGTQHIMHTLSRMGALRDLDNPDTFGMEVLNHDYPARDVASQALTTPWAPEWTAGHVDQKPLPFESTAAFRRWGGIDRRYPHWRRNYMTRHYGMASQDSIYGRVGFMTQWNRHDAPVERVQDVGTLLVRPGANFTELVASDGGALAVAGRRAILQHGPSAMILTQPPSWNGPAEDLRSLQTTLGIFDFRDSRDMEFHVDGQRIDALPFTSGLDRRIVIHDGATYIGIIPLPATDLGREYGLSIHRNDRTSEIGSSGVMVGPAVLVECYFLKKPTTRRDARRDHVPEQPTRSLDEPPPSPLDSILDDVMDDMTMTDEQRSALERVEQAAGETSTAFGGVIVRMADRDEFPDVQAFIEHIQAAILEVNEDADNPALKHVRFRDGHDGDTLEAGYRADRGWFTYRRANGDWPYLPVGIVRDTPLSVQGDTGLLEKNGFTLRTRSGAMMFLQTDPDTHTALALNPLPDLRPLSLTLPGAVEVTADSLLGLARIQVLEGGRSLLVDHAFKPGQADEPDAATALLVFGVETLPAVTLNEARLDPGEIRRGTVDGRNAWIIPLTATPPAVEAVNRRHSESRILLNPEIPANGDALIQDWYMVGPFPNADGAGFATEFGPEHGNVDLDRTFKGFDGQTVGWERLMPVAGRPVGSRGEFHLFHRYAPHTQWIAAYAYTRIHSDRDRDVLLLAGSDDTITVWLNGEKLHAHEVYRPVQLDQERVPLRLRKGDNHLLLKICQGDGGWGFVARLAEPRWGLPVTDGLTVGFATAE